MEKNKDARKLKEYYIFISRKSISIGDRGNLKENEADFQNNFKIEYGFEEDKFFKVRMKGPIPWILKHIVYGKNKIFIILWVLFTVLSTYFSSYIMIVIGNAIDAFEKNSFNQLGYYVILILVIGISGPAFTLFGNFSREFLAQRMERDARHEFYLILLGKSQSFHDQQRIGDIMARTADDVRMLNFLISPALSMIIESFSTIAIPIILIIVYFPYQMLISPIIFVVFFIISVRRYFNNLGPITMQMRRSFGNMNATVNETLMGIEVVKGLTLEEVEAKKFFEDANMYCDGQIKEGILQAKYFPLLLIALVVTLGLVHSIILANYGLLEIGQIISYLGLLMNLRRPTFISIWTFAIVRRAVSSAERLLEIMNKKGEISQNLGGIEKKIKGHVKFDNVSFHYPESDTYILKNLSFEVFPGQTVAIVGTTGSGKTTITKLISRLYDVSNGQIYIDGTPIQDFSLQSLRSQIASIEQDIFLFSYSINDNISFGRVSSKEEIEKAAEDAQAHEFIMNLPNQYETTIGEKGVQLSGGEQQRLAIARAFLTNPKILILDDSTSAIDSETEEKIQKAIKKILAGRTTFLITHRLSQIRWADRILVMKKGEIIAQGTHFELLKTCEEYQKIFIKRFDMSVEEILTGGK